jgi:hydrogenase expression/formation protein HypC
MCLGIPMQIIAAGEFQARCRGRTGEAWIDMRLVGAQPQGTWVLTFLDAAREVLDPERAAAIDAALDALERLQHGAPLSPGELDACFADLTQREPRLPDFLRKDAE